MRLNGSLETWNVDRGYGFIATPHGGAEIFVHASVYPREGGPPRIGEPLSFEVETDRSGRKRAARVLRPETSRRPTAARPSPRHQTAARASRGAASVPARIAAVALFAGPGSQAFL